jgi:uncharacterized repeat protein (TIGR03943 family)
VIRLRSNARVATSLVLAMWAAIFWFLILAERTPFYLSSRTTWLAPLGAVTLTMASLGLLASSRFAAAEPLTTKHVRRLVILALPAIAIVVVPPATLGSYAVAKRSSPVRGGYVAVPGQDIGSGDLSLLDIFSVSFNNEFYKLSRRAGTLSSFVGFVSNSPDDRADEFQLNRFLITCCPGDAISVAVRVVGAPPGRFQSDDWVRVTGRIYPLGKEVIVDASEIERIERPARPYLGS